MSLMPEKFDIEEPDSLSEGNESVVDAGSVEAWSRLEIGKKNALVVADQRQSELWRREEVENNEKRKIRIAITSAVLIIWVVWTFIGIFDYFFTHDFYLLLSSGITIIPATIIFRYYFK